MGLHTCGSCGRDLADHNENCFEGTPDGESSHIHFPALCCPGCDCGSFEEAHPDSPLADPEVVAVLREFQSLASNPLT